MYVDCHCHLDLMNINKVNISDKYSNIERIILASNNISSYKVNLNLSLNDNRFIPSLGIHPLNVRNNFKDLVKIVENIRNGSILGEIGLDHYFIKEKKDWDLQEKVFKTFLFFAQKFNSMIIIHSKGAESKILDILENYKIKKVVFHWFSGTSVELKRILDRNYYVSIGPALFFSKKVQIIARKAYLGNILTESDAPFGIGKHRFFPNQIIDVVKKISEIKSIKEEELKTTIYQNFLNFLNNSNSLNKAVV